MIIGEDKGPYGGGPTWIFTSLSYENNNDKTELLVRSPAMKTPTDFWIKASAGFHYCKILSPARVVEWIYVDGLKAHYSIKKDN